MLLSPTGLKVSLSLIILLTIIVTTNATIYVIPFIITDVTFTNGFNSINNTNDSISTSSVVFSNNARDITKYKDIVLIKSLVLFYRPILTTVIAL